jgi:hypothetical protein
MRTSKFIKVEKAPSPATAVCHCSNCGDLIVASQQEAASFKPLFCSTQCEEFFATRNKTTVAREKF